MLKRDNQTIKTSRDAAVERLSTPDQLDQVIQVAPFPHWLALSALFVLILAGALAAVFLPVPVTVRGEGILINVGGILTVTSGSEGRLEELMVKPGHTVATGQLVARLDQPRLRQELANREAELEEARNRRKTIEKFHRKSSEVRNQTVSNQRRALEQRHEFALKHRDLLEEQLAGEEELLKKGVIARVRVNETRTRLNEARDEVTTIENEIKSFIEILTGEELTRERELLEIQLALADLERQVATLGAELERQSEVRSPYDGRVVELVVNPGEIIERHGPLFSLLPIDAGAAASGTTDLIAVLYVPPAEGKKIEPGKDVQVAVSSIKREEFGFMLGVVESVAEVPSTPEGMMRILKNVQLAQQLSKDHAPFEVRVRLLRDPETVSGYRWSSSQGPRVKVNVGTLCEGDIITGRKRPIVLLVPIFARLFEDSAAVVLPGA